MARVGENPGTLIEIGGNSRIAPTMSIRAHFAITIKIIEQDIVAGQLMLVGRHIFAVHNEIGISVSRRLARGILEIAKDLVVRAILFNDIENVFDRAWLADTIGNDGLTWHRSPLKSFGPVRRIFSNLFGVASHLG